MDEQIRAVLDFWFRAGARDTPTIDSRMDRWFSPDADFDEQIRQRFSTLCDAAMAGQLDAWAHTAPGRLALILLLDQFPRHLHRGLPAAFAGDARALRLCVDGARDGQYRELAPLEQAFFFMPLQHAENLKAQEKAVRIYSALIDSAGDTLRETLETFAQFAELHRDIIASYGRFPHRNRALGRSSTAEEAGYLEGGGLSFGQ